jgi:hypothetical protein
MEAVLMFDDKDFEEEQAEEMGIGDIDTNITTESQPDTQSKLSDSQSPEKFQVQTEEEKFEAGVLEIGEEYRDWYREARFYPDELY